MSKRIKPRGLVHRGTKFVSGSPILLEGAKVVLAGVMLELARRTSNQIIDALSPGLKLQATIRDSDPAFDWLMYWIRQQVSPSSDSEEHPNRHNLSATSIPIWKDMLESLFPTGRLPPKKMLLRTHRPSNDPERDDSRGDPNDPDRPSDDVEVFRLPPKASDLNLPFQGLSIRFVLITKDKHGDVLEMSVNSFDRSREIFTPLIYHARTIYLRASHSRLSIFTPQIDRWWMERWDRTSLKPIRPWESVFLPKRVKEGVFRDTREFLSGKNFYRDRGLPWRRGWLLYGLPGTGKTSLITAIASHFKLGIYIVNLGTKGLDAHVLQALVSDCLAKCILLFEDIDCAFRTRKSTKPSKEKKKSSGDKAKVAENTLEDKEVEAKAEKVEPGVDSTKQSKQSSFPDPAEENAESASSTGPSAPVNPEKQATVSTSSSEVVATLLAAGENDTASAPKGKGESVTADSALVGAPHGADTTAPTASVQPAAEAKPANPTAAPAKKEDDTLPHLITNSEWTTVAAAPSSAGSSRRRDSDEEEDDDVLKRSQVTFSGLLNAIDGLAASEGRILFCTTNHVGRIDPALSRPGRCDVWVEFAHATKDQAYDLFKYFYAPSPSEGRLASASKSPYELSHKFDHSRAQMDGTDMDKADNTISTLAHPLVSPTSMNQQAGARVEYEDVLIQVHDKSLGTDADLEDAYTRSSSTTTLAPSGEPEDDGSLCKVRAAQHTNATAATDASSRVRLRQWTESELSHLATVFADSLPEKRLTISSLQGYLMGYKYRPDRASNMFAEWVRVGCPQSLEMIR